MVRIDFENILARRFLEETEDFVTATEFGSIDGEQIFPLTSALP